MIASAALYWIDSSASLYWTYVTCLYSHVIRMYLHVFVCHSYATRMCSSFVCHSHVLVYHMYVTRMYSYVIVCHSNALFSHSHVTRLYSQVIRILLVCTRMLSVCHSYVLVSHPYVTRMYSYVIRMSLVHGFTMNLFVLSSFVHFIWLLLLEIILIWAIRTRL